MEVRNKDFVVNRHIKKFSTIHRAFAFFSTGLTIVTLIWVTNLGSLISKNTFLFFKICVIAKCDTCCLAALGTGEDTVFVISLLETVALL